MTQVVETNPLNRDVTHLIDSSVGRIEQSDGAASANTLYFVVNDHLGRPEQIFASTADATLKWKATNTAYGRKIVTTEKIGDYQIGFPGQYHDEETGFAHNVMRDYDQATGRYLQPDPIGLAGGVNLYGYVGGNPVMFVDPSGLVNLEIAGVPISIHANPGPSATDSRAEHGPAHVHLGANDGPRLNIRTFEPFSEEDSREMTKEMKKMCKNFSNKEKNLIRKRAAGVFKRGWFFKLVGGSVVPSIGAAASLRAAYDSSGGSEGIMCEANPELESCPGE